MDYALERMGVGSNEIAKGNTGIADTTALFSAYWNPAMLAFKRDFFTALHAENRKPYGMGASIGVENGVAGRMGLGAAILFGNDEDFLIVNEDEDIADIKVSPLSMLGYLGLGYRLSKLDGIGASLSIAYDNWDFSNEWETVSFQSPLSFNLGWFRFWNEKWQSGLQIRNLGFNSKLSASWNRSPSKSLSDISLFRPKTFEAGVTHRNLILNKPVSVSLSLLSYQIADTLFVFDPDWHIFKGRVGFEWRIVRDGELRFGIDGKSLCAGWGYEIDIGNKVLLIDYAAPLSLTLRMRF